MNSVTVSFAFMSNLNKEQLQEKVYPGLCRMLDQKSRSMGDHTAVVVRSIVVEEINTPTPTNRELAMTWWRENISAISLLLTYTHQPEYNSILWTGRTIEDLYNKINK